ncbi:MAG: DUF4058 family protein [Fimbriiglobus sp.]
MPSPFPGMNPFLEHPHAWTDFHQTYIIGLREVLAPRVVPNYYVQVQEHIYFHFVEGTRELGGVADLGVIRKPAQRPRKPGSAVATVPAPVHAVFPKFVKERLGYLEICDRDEHTVITVIELLSPANKRPGGDREAYINKRQSLLATDVNFVELDLLRAGPRLPLDHLPACDYYAIVSRPAQRPTTDVWPVRLREPLPAIPIPLRKGEPEPRLDLQAALHSAYDRAGYVYGNLYSRPLVPPLAADDAAWAAALVPATARG